MMKFIKTIWGVKLASLTIGVFVLTNFVSATDLNFELGKMPIVQQYQEVKSFLSDKQEQLTTLLKDQVASTIRSYQDVFAGFNTLKSSLISSLTLPTTQLAQTSQAVTQAISNTVQSFDSTSLKSELEQYINERIANLQQPIVYNTTQVINPVILREQIIREDVRPTVTRQSNADADRRSVTLSAITESGTLTSPTITGGTISGATITGSTFSGTSATITNLTVTSCTGCGGGAAFAWTPTSYGVSTSTTLAFTQGFLSTASSTIDSTLLITGSTTLQNFTFSTATGTSATTTNFFSTTASSTNLFSTNANLSLVTLGNATSTNFFSTTASSTNLFSSLLTVGGNTLVVDSSRNVGIGTTTPQYKLTINSSNSTDNFFQISSTTNQNIFSINSSGNIQLGTNALISRNTSDASDSGLIQIAGGGSAGVSRGAFLQIEGNEAGGNIYLVPGDVAGAFTGIMFNNNGDYAAKFLESDGSATFTSTAQQAVKSVSTHASGGGFTSWKSGTEMFRGGAGTWVSPSAGTNDGGIQSPNGALYIISSNGAIYFNSTSDVVKPITDNEESLGQSTFRWSIVYAAGGVNTSDEREKKDIQDIPIGLDFISAIRPVSYRWKSPKLGEGVHYGVIAQQLDTLLPSDAGSIDKSNPDVWGLHFNDLWGPTIKAIQELNLNLESIASTTATSTPQSESFAASFFENLFNRITTWLADAANGITKLFAKEIETELLCVRDEGGTRTCVTKAQLDSLLANSGSGSTTIYSEPAADSSSTSGSTATTTDATTTDTTTSTSTDLTTTTDTSTTTEPSTSTPESTSSTESTPSEGSSEPAPASEPEPVPETTP